MFELAFIPDRDSPTPVYRQLGDALRALIDRGRLSPGVKLPATRDLCASLRLHRNTVSRAYQDLISEGYLTAHVGQGTFVAARPPRLVPRPPVPEASDAQTFVWSGFFAHRARDLVLHPAFRRPAASMKRPRAPFCFRGGEVAADALPEKDLRRAFDKVVSYRLSDLANHVDPRGFFPLRRAIAQHLAMRGVDCGPEEVLVVNGSQQAIDLLGRVLLDPDDNVAVEQPGYFGATLAFQACGANLIGIPVDEEGLRTDALERVLRKRRLKLVYTTPAAHCPTSVTMSEGRRRALLRLADEHQVPIVEDDYDSELRYEGPPVPALKGQDAAGQVIHVGTFSKIVFPGLRLGYIVGPGPLLDKLALAKWVADVQSDIVGQAAMAELLESGGLDRHIRRMRKIYKERLGVMREALAQAMPRGTGWTAPAGGHLVWVTLPPGVQPESFAEAALETGVECTPGDLFYFDGQGRDRIALSFANMAPDAIREGIALLGRVLQRHLAPSRRRSGR